MGDEQAILSPPKRGKTESRCCHCEASGALGGRVSGLWSCHPTSLTLTGLSGQQEQGHQHKTPFVYRPQSGREQPKVLGFPAFNHKPSGPLQDLGKHIFQKCRQCRPFNHASSPVHHVSALLQQSHWVSMMSPTNTLQDRVNQPILASVDFRMASSGTPSLVFFLQSG